MMLEVKNSERQIKAPVRVSLGVDHVEDRLGHENLRRGTASLNKGQ